MLLGSTELALSADPNVENDLPPSWAILDPLFAPLAAAFTHIRDSAIIYSADGEVVVWNNGATRLFGYSFEEARGQEACFLCLPGQSNDTLKLFSRAVAGHPVEPCRVERVQKDGSTICVSTRVTPLEDADGNVFGVLFLSSDVSREVAQERRETELKMRESDIATLVPDALFVHRNNEIVWANAAAIETFGAQSVEEFVGRSPWDLIAPDDLPRIKERNANLGPAELSRPTFAHRVRLDGVSFPSEGRGASITWEGEPATLMTVRDLSDQERTANALAESEKRQRDLVDISPDAILVHIDGEIVFANQAAVEMFGATTEADLVGRQNSTLVHPDDWRRITASWSENDEANDSDLLEVRQLRLDGSEFIGQGSGKHISWHGRDAFIAVIRDVTDQIEAMKALAESEARQRDFAQISPDAMLIHIDGRIVFVNDAAIEMFRAESADKLIGQEVLNTIHPDDRNVLQTKFDAVEVSAGIDFFEAKRLRLDGTTFEGEGRFRPVQWEGNAAILVVIRDITDRKAAQAKLLESEQFHRQIVQVNPDAVIIHAEGKIVFVNQSAVDTFRAKDESELLGRAINDLVPPEMVEHVEMRRQQVEERGFATTTPALRQRLDGTGFMADVTGSRCIWEGSAAILSVMRDATDRIETQQVREEIEERYQRILDLSPDAIFVHCESRLVYTNPAAVQMFGASDRFELIGRDVTDFIHPDARERVVQSREILDGGGNISNERVSRLRLDGTPFVSDSNGAMIDWDGNQAFLVIAREISGQGVQG